MPMSFDGHAANSSGWFIRPRVQETGSTGSAERHRNSLPTGHYAMATAEHREPCESRGSRTVLGAPEGESPSGDSTIPWPAITVPSMTNQHAFVLVAELPGAISFASYSRPIEANVVV